MEFKLITWLIIIDGFLLGNILMVDGKEFCTNKTNGVQWTEKKTTFGWTAFRQYPGEWWIANCRIKNLSNVVVAQLLHVKSSSGERKIVHVDGIKLKNNGNVFNLTNLNRSDTGEYYCKACGKEKRVGGFDIETRGKPFQYPTIVNKPSGPIDFGSDFTLICEVAGAYQLKWWDKDGVASVSKLKILNKNTKNHTIEARLEIKKFNKAKEGLYVCNATRSIVGWIATDEVRIKMKDFMKPTFLNFPEESISLEEGKIFNKTIIVNGSPKPDVDCWEMNKKRKNIKRSGNLVFIYISKVLYSRDNGTRFQCNASNINGSIDKVFRLNVLVEPQINGEEQERKKTYSLTSSTLNLPCEIDQANPVPSIEWTYSYKDDENDENDTKWLPIKAKNGGNVHVVNESILSVVSQSEYRVFYKCLARNSLGEDKFTWEVLDERNREENTSSEKASTSYMIASIVVSIIIFLFILFVITVLYKRKKRYGGFYIFTLPPPRDYIKSLDSSKSLQEQLHKLPYLTEWEFPRENIFLLSEIGSGAFGVVYLADAVGLASFRPRDILNEKKNQRRFSLGRFRRKNPYSFDQVVVKTAVKTLKDEHNQSELADLHSELKIMIHVGEHENILKILGASTKGDDNKPPSPLIILEYCAHGNLRQFLRSRRDIYLPEWKEIDNVQLSITDLITFAFQISKGMDFLISRKCIHRDLAARNVLVDKGYVAKISDFGLARNVYGNLEYVKLSSDPSDDICTNLNKITVLFCLLLIKYMNKGLLPLKWMAIEAINDRVFNEKTDVWSYGILLWEMFTLGGTPYPDLHPSEVLQTLINGNRMKPPMYCPEDISDMMASTWNENPSERPSFPSIVDDLQNLCESKAAELKLCYQNIPFDDLLHDSQFDDLEV